MDKIIVRGTMLLPVPWVSQEGPYATRSNDCGPACAVMVLNSFGIGGGKLYPDDFYTKMGIASDTYISVSLLQNYLKQYGIETVWKTKLSATDIFLTLSSQKPMIALISYGVLVDAGLTAHRTFRGPHFVVIGGFDTYSVYINDPYNLLEGEAVAVPWATFTAAWEAVGHNQAVPNPACGALITVKALNEEPGLESDNFYQVQVTAAPSMNVRSEPSASQGKVTILRQVEAGKILNIYEEVKDANKVVWGKIDPELAEWISLYWTKRITKKGGYSPSLLEPAT